MKKMVLYGNTILSRMVLLDAAGREDFAIAAVAVDAEYLDGDVFAGDTPHAVPQVDVARVRELFPPESHGLLAVLGGYARIRSRSEFFRKAVALGYPMANYMSARADVAPDVAMGVNNIVMAGAHVGTKVRMGDGNLVRQSAYLGHECVLGDHNVLGPGCRVGGRGTIGGHCYVCIGATVIDSIALADETLVGAGGVVIRNTEPHSKNVGNPTRVIGYHREEGIRMSADHG